MENSNDEEKEEEVIVYASFEEGTVDKEILQQTDLKLKIVGLDSNTPVVQLGDTTFRGVWNDALGTKIFFEEDLSPEPVDPVFTVIPPKMLKYKCMSTKTLELSRIFLKPKNPDNLTNLTNIDKHSDQEEEEKVEKELYLETKDEIKDDTVLNLVQGTINPDQSTLTIMSDIVNESAAGIL